MPLTPSAARGAHVGTPCEAADHQAAHRLNHRARQQGSLAGGRQLHAVAKAEAPAAGELERSDIVTEASLGMRSVSVTTHSATTGPAAARAIVDGLRSVTSARSRPGSGVRGRESFRDGHHVGQPDR
jgi:hypothetical protein